MDGRFAEGSAGDRDRWGGMVFWGLVLLGYACLSMCVLLPEWRTWQLLRVEEQIQAYRLEDLGRSVERYRREIEALRSDPATVTRLAQREFNYHRRVEKTVSVPLVAAQSGPERTFEPEFPSPPAAIAPLVARLPAYPYDRVFCDPGVRFIVLCMSLGLIVAAFTLFCRPKAHQA
ncbi:MAG: hypothetical protein J5J06_17810 [Phycisphaerae bacterium]|nr:hypothetical protein [Phycisphaerae bacterium]